MTAGDFVGDFLRGDFGAAGDALALVVVVATVLCLRGFVAGDGGDVD
jgi:hypothetical protein